MRKALSYALLHIGHCISKVMDYWPFDLLHPYPVYNWLMCKSIDAQGDGEGPWRAPDMG